MIIVRMARLELATSGLQRQRELHLLHILLLSEIQDSNLWSHAPKARVIAIFTNLRCLAEDTGFEPVIPEGDGLALRCNSLYANPPTTKKPLISKGLCLRFYTTTTTPRR